MDSFSIHAAINPQGARTTEMLPTLQQVRAILSMSAIKAKHIDIY
jgi:hypothetical protein